MAKQNSEIPPNALDEDGPVPHKSSLKKWVILGALVVLPSGCRGRGGLLFLPEYMPAPLNFFGQKPAKGSSAHKKPPEEERGYIYTMDPFIVNLADIDQNRYLKLRMNLERRNRNRTRNFPRNCP